MALGTVGMVADSPVSINDSEVAAISYPTFWSDLSQIVNENGN
jgi:5-enolpyruvylshikimate-3-phosphate synthase